MTATKPEVPIANFQSMRTVFALAFVFFMMTFYFFIIFDRSMDFVDLGYHVVRYSFPMSIAASTITFAVWWRRPFWLGWDRWYWPWLCLLVCIASLTLIPAEVALLLDQWLDPSPAIAATYTIADKYYYRSYRSSSHYTIHYLPVSNNPTVKYALDISAQFYRRIEPHRTTVTLYVHPGAFGSPWYENHWYYENLMPANTK